MKSIKIESKDGPSSVLILNNRKKLTLKQWFHRFRYDLKRKRIEKTISSTEYHSMEEVLTYAVNECGLVEVDREDVEVKEEYDEVRASFLLQYHPELLDDDEKLPSLNSEEPKAVMEHMQKNQDRIRRAKDVPRELFDIDFHKFEQKYEDDNEELFVSIETNYGYIGGSACGDRAIKRLNDIMVRLYKYYGVTQEDIDNRTERYRHLVSELCR